MKTDYHDASHRALLNYNYTSASASFDMPGHQTFGTHHGRLAVARLQYRRNSHRHASSVINVAMRHRRCVNFARWAIAVLILIVVASSPP